MTIDIAILSITTLAIIALGITIKNWILKKCRWESSERVTLFS
jgi:hypothetical protein